MALERIPDEEIRAIIDGHGKKSRKIWGSGKSRLAKVEEAMDLPSIYSQIAQAQLKSCEAQIPAIERAAMERVRDLIDAEYKKARAKTEAMPYLDRAANDDYQMAWRNRADALCELLEALKSELGKGDEG